MKVTTSAQRWS